MAHCVLVTGSTDGIGKQAVLDLAERGARVVLHGRSEARLGDTLEAVRKKRPDAAAGTVKADLSSMAEVRAMADEVSRRFPDVDVLVNNAGVFMNEEVKTKDGFETTIAVNHLAPFLLTHLLLETHPKLRRIVNVASMAHSGGHVDRKDLLWERRPFSGYRAYGDSKLANVLFTVELARRGKSRGLVANAMHPGVITTKLLQTGFGMRGGESAKDGSNNILLLALEPEDRIGSGNYFSHLKRATPSAEARDPELARLFYEASARAALAVPLPG